MNAERKSSPSGSRPPRRKLRLALLMLLIGGGTALIVAVAVHFQDRRLDDAEQQLEQGQPNKAIELVDAYLQSQPKNSRALAIKARALSETGRPADAIRLFRQAGVASEKDLHALARALMIQQQWSEATPVLQRVLELKPDNPDALYEVTVCRMRLGLYDDAIQSARRLAKIPGFEARGCVLLGTLHYDKGNQFRAADAWKKALEHNPDAAGLQITAREFFLAYGRLLAEAGRTNEALPLLERSAALEPTAEVHVWIGRCRSRLGQHEQATAAWQRALTLERLNPDAREALAGDALRRRRPDEALSWLFPAVEAGLETSSTAYLVQRAHTMKKDDDTAQIWRQKADVLRKREKLLATIDHSLVQSPNSYWSRVVRAYRFAEQGNWGQSEAIIGPIIERTPDEPFVRRLAESIRKRGKLPPLTDLPIEQF